MDVTTAFLNGELNECVYMKQPEGYIEKEKEQMSPTCWNSALDAQLQSMGLAQLKSDPCLYVSASMEKDPLIVAIYVDDIIIAGKMQDLKNGKVWIGQPSYTKNIVEDFRVPDAKPASSPVYSSLKLKKASVVDEIEIIELYQSAVCKLLYLSTRSRPDIAYAVFSIARFTANPTKEHWKALKHIFRYLVGTINYGILYS
uniref:Reverse transcriptase Ty1/copia-type domain-containing protein n=1 Tax=Amphimedon queenslandica TaxID=400682 RepID=A0A1X7V4Q9_AMPQE